MMTEFAQFQSAFIFVANTNIRMSDAGRHGANRARETSLPSDLVVFYLQVVRCLLHLHLTHVNEKHEMRSNLGCAHVNGWTTKKTNAIGDGCGQWFQPWIQNELSSAFGLRPPWPLWLRNRTSPIVILPFSFHHFRQFAWLVSNVVAYSRKYCDRDSKTVRSETASARTSRQNWKIKIIGMKIHFVEFVATAAQKKPKMERRGGENQFNIWYPFSITVR